MWVETVTGTAWNEDASIPAFDTVVNALLQRIELEGGVVTNIAYSAFMGFDNLVLHSALVTYRAKSQVSYQQVLADIGSAVGDREAAIGFETDALDTLTDWVDNDDS